MFVKMECRNPGKQHLQGIGVWARFGDRGVGGMNLDDADSGKGRSCAAGTCHVVPAHRSPEASIVRHSERVK